ARTALSTWPLPSMRKPTLPPLVSRLLIVTLLLPWMSIVGAPLSSAVTLPSVHWVMINPANGGLITTFSFVLMNMPITSAATAAATADDRSTNVFAPATPVTDLVIAAFGSSGQFGVLGCSLLMKLTTCGAHCAT